MSNSKVEMAANRIKVLTEDLKRYNLHYYSHDESLISDAEYDSLLRELEELERLYPDLSKSDSPTRTVGTSVGNHFKTFPHLTPMLSLANVFTVEDLKIWLSTIHDDDLIYVEDKADGVSLDLIYKDGKLVQALTRGDGLRGEDVTLNAFHIEDIPNTLVDDVGTICVRGEVLVTHEDFDEINESLEDSGRKTFANPRNYASGSLRQKNSNVTKSRKLKFRAYSVDLHNGERITETNEEYEFFSENDFTSLSTYERIKMYSVDEVLSLLESDPGFNLYRESHPFVIDGLVFKVGDRTVREEMGSTSRAPKWAVAYKFPAAHGISTLCDIKYQVGRTGVLTPVAVINPVFVCGTTITNVTLHNPQEVMRLNLTRGCQVSVERAGDVIPKITGSLDDTGEPFFFPSACPSCSTPVITTRVKDSDFLYCPNVLCRDRQIQHLLYCASRLVFDIKLMGPEIITLLFEKGIVKASQPLRLLTLTDEDFLSVGISELMSHKLALSVATALSELTIPSVIMSFGINNVAEGTSLRLYRSLKTLKAIASASIDELMQIKDIGLVTATNLYNFFEEDRLKPAEDSAFYPEVAPTDPFVPTEGSSDILKDIVILVTGSKFNKHSRKEITELLKNNGATVTSNVSKKTTFGVLGTNPTQHKVDTLIEQSIPMISYDKTGNCETTLSDELQDLFDNVIDSYATLQV